MWKQVSCGRTGQLYLVEGSDVGRFRFYCHVRFFLPLKWKCVEADDLPHAEEGLGPNWFNYHRLLVTLILRVLG